MTETAKCFPPVYDKNSKVLLLGTIPSRGSVKHGFYYMGAGNAFWELLSYSLDFDFSSLAAAVKGADEKTAKTAKERLIAALYANNIALYDTIGEGIRHGSRDDQIDKSVLQQGEDILKIIKNSSVRKIFCTSAQALNNLYKIFGGKVKAEEILRREVGLSDNLMPCEKILSPSATAIMYGQVTNEMRKKDWEKLRQALSKE